MQPGKSSSRLAFRATLAVAALLLTAGCGTSFGAQTNDIYQPAAGVNYREGNVYALNVLVVLHQGQGTVIGALLNQARRPDALVDLSGQAANQSALSTSIAGSRLELPSEQLVQMGEDAAVSASGGDLTPGSIAEITLSFRNAAPITLQVPVVPRTGYYATVPVTP